MDNLKDNIKELTAALYRVTEFLPDQEAVKWELRECGLKIYKILSQPSFYNSKNLGTAFFGAEAYAEMLNLNKAIIGLLDIASFSSRIPSLNFSVLKREYEKLKDFLESKQREFTEIPMLGSPSFLGFSLEEPKAEDKGQAIHKGQESNEQPHSKGHSKGQESYKGQKDKGQKTAIKDKTGIKDIKLKAGALKGAKSKVKPVSKYEEAAWQRKNKILEILSGGSRKTAREIAEMMAGVSQKTVQRDLMNLSKEGKLKAEGEKRWRFYSLAE